MEKYPTMNAIKNADREQIRKWFRDLPYPNDADEMKLLEAVTERIIEFQKMGD